MADSWSEIATAVGTMGAVIVAMWIAGADARRRRKEEQRRQAEQISAWMEELPNEVAITEGELHANLILQNTSNQLVYNLIASIVSAHSEAHIGDNLSYRTFVGLLPPGRTEYTIKHPGHGMHRKFAIELAFEDTGGRGWIRQGLGGLKQISKDPLAFYEIDPPVGWLMP
jgi:hypothetical protein